MRVQYGYSIVRPEMIAQIVTPPPPSPTERLFSAVNTAVDAAGHIFVTVAVLALGALLLTYSGMGALAGLFGIAVGMLSYLMWDARRG